MKDTISISNFNFRFSGYGHYVVTYTSNTGKSFQNAITDMELIDKTKNCDNPKKVDLNRLKTLCKC